MLSKAHLTSHSKMWPTNLRVFFWRLDILLRLLVPRPGPTQQPVGSGAEMPQARQPRRWEYNPSHQQTGYLMSSGAHSTLLNTTHDMALPTRGTRSGGVRTVGPHQSSHPLGSLQKPQTGLIHQGADSRSKKNHSPAGCGTETATNSSNRKGRPDATAEEYVLYKGAR